MKVLHIFFMLVFGVMMCSCGSESSLKDYDGMGIFEVDSIIISSEANGKIESLNLKQGQEIKKGELIARLDCKALNLQAKEMQLQIENAMREKSRISRLVAGSAAVSRDLDSANFNVKLLQSKLDILQDSINKCEIFSPLDSVILEKYASVNEFSNVGKPLVKLANLKLFSLKAYLIQSDVTRVKIGDKVRVFSDYGDTFREYSGKISYISPQAEWTPKSIMTKNERQNLVYAIKIDVENDGYLKIGSYGQIKLLESK